MSIGPGPVTTVSFVPSLVLVNSYLNDIASELSRTESPLREAVQKVVIPSMQVNFAVSGRPHWAPLSDSTVEFRRMLGQSWQSVLVKSGALRSAMASESLWTFSDDEAALNKLPSDVWYGMIHQDGYPGGATHPIPARPFAVLQPEDEEAIDELFLKWMGEAIDNGWPGV